MFDLGKYELDACVEAVKSELQTSQGTAAFDQILGALESLKDRCQRQKTENSRLRKRTKPLYDVKTRNRILKLAKSEEEEPRAVLLKIVELLE